MTTIKNIHPVYFNSFVGIWKRMSAKGSPANGYIKFNSDCTFEDDGSFNPIEGTINGDVDEISVEEDGHGHDRRAKIEGVIKSKAIKGTAVLTKDSNTQKWSYRISKGNDINNNDMKLEFRRNNKRIIYVGNLPLTDEEGNKSFKNKVKV